MVELQTYQFGIQLGQRAGRHNGNNAFFVMCAPTAKDRVITLSNSQCHVQIMISNITETCVMFNKPSRSISSDGHSEDDDKVRTEMVTVAATVAVSSLPITAPARCLPGGMET